MITDTLSNSGLYETIGPRFAKAFRFLRETDFSGMVPDRYEIDGSDIFFMVQEYTVKTQDAASIEAHRVYADIQLVIKGREKMGYAPLENVREKIPYDAERDIAKYEGDIDFVTYKEGMFAVFMPHDAHQPCVGVEEGETVKKVVIKVRC